MRDERGNKADGGSTLRHFETEGFDILGGRAFLGSKNGICKDRFELIDS